MVVKIITDSLSDIASDIADELGITVVPLTVIFGHDSYLDRVTITTDEFYDRLIHGDVLATTTQPAPRDFAAIYNKLAEETDEILVITLSSKISGTYQSAVSAKELVKKDCRIEVIDSGKVAMGLGLIVIAAAKATLTGANLDDLIKLARNSMPRSHLMVYFDTLKYLEKGGRIGKAKALVGAMLSIKQILTIKEGEMAPVTRFRSQSAGMEYLYNFVASFPHVDELAVEHTTLPDEANKLVERLSVLFPAKVIYRSTVSPVMGVYAGPNAIAVTVLESQGRG